MVEAVFLDLSESFQANSRLRTLRWSASYRNKRDLLSLPIWRYRSLTFELGTVAAKLATNVGLVEVRYETGLRIVILFLTVLMKYFSILNTILIGVEAAWPVC